MRNKLKFIKRKVNIIEIVNYKDIIKYEKENNIKVSSLNEIEYSNFLEEVKNSKKILFAV